MVLYTSHASAMYHQNLLILGTSLCDIQALLLGQKPSSLPDGADYRPPKKRRKLNLPEADGVEYLTLAKVDIRLVNNYTFDR